MEPRRAGGDQRVCRERDTKDDQGIRQGARLWFKVVIDGLFHVIIWRTNGRSKVFDIRASAVHRFSSSEFCAWVRRHTSLMARVALMLEIRAMVALIGCDIFCFHDALPIYVRTSLLSLCQPMLVFNMICPRATVRRTPIQIYHSIRNVLYRHNAGRATT